MDEFFLLAEEGENNLVWLLVVSVIVAPLLIYKGIVGIRDEYYVGKWGMEFEGLSAQIFGGFSLVIGIALPVILVWQWFRGG